MQGPRPPPLPAAADEGELALQHGDRTSHNVLLGINRGLERSLGGRCDARLPILAVPKYRPNPDIEGGAEMGVKTQRVVRNSCEAMRVLL